MRSQPASYLTFCLSVSLVLFVAQGIDGRSASFTKLKAAAQKVESIPIPGTKAFPESITSTTDGTLYVGRVGDGGIVRVKPRTAESTVFVRPGASGSRSILGVFADEASSTLWACSNDLSALGGPATGSDTESALKGFDLQTGDGKRSVSLPGSHAFCNDITVDAQGLCLRHRQRESHDPETLPRRYDVRSIRTAIPPSLRLKAVSGSTGSPSAATATST